jgi:hypothetical protein
VTVLVRVSFISPESDPAAEFWTATGIVERTGPADPGGIVVFKICPEAAAAMFAEITAGVNVFAEVELDEVITHI